MFSSSARRLVIANATRQSAASARTSQQCRRLAPSSARSFVSFAQQQSHIAQTKHNDGRQPPWSVSSTATTCHQRPSAARLLASADQRRQLSSGGDDLPYHIVVGMPALSPTMESGTISKWNVAEGESFSAGDSLAVIETDKASIFFEAQEDGILAKILAGAGAGEMAVGVPIMVTVEEEEDVAAFANYVAGAEEDAPAAASAVEEVIAEPVAAAAAPVPAAAPTPVAVPVAAAVAAAPTAPTGAISMSQPGVSSEKWE